MMKHRWFVLAVLMSSMAYSAVSLCPLKANAQGSDQVDDIEGLFSEDEEKQLKAQDAAVESKAEEQELKEVSDLAQLAPFKDIAVIQRRFLPKTGRFELFGGGSFVMNDAFFNNFGLSGRMGYNFSERYGIEIVGLFFTTTERSVTTDLREKRGVLTTNLVTSRNYLGADFKWTPIYGKMTLFNRKITPFDLYFSVGAGSTGTNKDTSEPTLHLGTGQVFALSKSMAARWDFSWNFFSSDSGGASGSSNYNSLFITIGMSFFFPEASYR